MADDLWADDSISATLNQIGLTAGADSELPDEVRFVRRVREILHAVHARHGTLTAPAVYMFVPSSDDVSLADTTFHHRLHTGELDPAGKLWMVASAARSGRSLQLPGVSADEIFEFCLDTGLGGAPAVYCDAAADPQIFAWYPSGLSQPDDVIETPIQQEATPTLDQLIEVVDRVHRTRLMTSLNQGVDTTLWEKRSHHWVHERAEKRVQDALMAGLGGAFGNPYFVEQERKGDAGRFDIGFRESLGGGTSTLHSIIELKVARSHGSGGIPVSEAATEAHVIDGVEQARSYSDEHETRDAACLVFDLRVADEQIPPPAAHARSAALDVFLRFWRCFPTADDYRTFTLPN